MDKGQRPPFSLHGGSICFVACISKLSTTWRCLLLGVSIKKGSKVSTLVSILRSLYRSSGYFGIVSPTTNKYIVSSMVIQLFYTTKAVFISNHFVALIAVITDPPRAVNISVNGVAEFNCTASAPCSSIIIIWTVNESETSGDYVTTRGVDGNSVKSTIRLSAYSVNNAATTYITCTLTIIGNSIAQSIETSNPVLLMIQGKAILLWLPL